MNGRKFNVDYWYEIYDLIYKFSDDKLIKLIEYIKALMNGAFFIIITKKC